MDLINYYVARLVTARGEVLDGMYTQGERAATPELARDLLGVMRAPKSGERAKLLLECSHVGGIQGVERLVDHVNIRVGGHARMMFLPGEHPLSHTA